MLLGPKATTKQQQLQSWAKDYVIFSADLCVQGTCLLETQAEILDKFLQKFMKIPKKEEQEDVKEEQEEQGEEEEEEPEGSGKR